MYDEKLQNNVVNIIQIHIKTDTKRIRRTQKLNSKRLSHYVMIFPLDRERESEMSNKIMQSGS